MITYIKAMYRGQKRRSILRGHPQPEYSKEQFIDKLSNSKKFLRLYEDYCESNFSKDLAPSLDRKDITKHYFWKNLRLVTWKQNAENEYARRRLPVYAYSLSGELLKEFSSITEAKIYYDLKSSAKIKLCCYGVYLTYMNMQWSYTKLDSLPPVLSKTDRMIETKKILIYQYSTSGKFIKEWKGTNVISSFYNLTGLHNSLSDFTKTYSGYVWRKAIDVDFSKKDIEPVKDRNEKSRKAVVKLSLEGAYIEKFDTVSLASKSLDLSRSVCGHINSNCMGGRNSAYGYDWWYLEDYIKYLKDNKIEIPKELL